MEEDIDLRPFLEAIIKQWKIILGLTVLAAIVAFVVTSFQTPTYQATALVVITAPQQFVLESLTEGDLSPSLATVNKSSHARAFPELAVSGELLQELLLGLNQAEIPIENIEDMRTKLDAEVGSDSTILRLTVKDSDPVHAAEIANSWAALFVLWVNKVFSNSGDERVSYFETQYENAKFQLDKSEQDLTQFQASNKINIISNNLDFFNQNQVDLLNEQRDVQLLLQDVQDLQMQLESLPNNGDILPAYHLTALNLQLRAFNHDNSTAVNPYQLQLIPSESLIGTDKETQLTFLNTLETTLDGRGEQLAIYLNELEPEILEIQLQLQEVETEFSRLERTQTEAEETYTALSRKLIEEKISSQDTIGGVRLAGLAITPNAPISSGRLLTTFVAGLLGGLIGIAIVFVRQWWKRDETS